MRCVDSLLSQTFSDIEIILVDDGSLDQSLLVCKNYEKKDNRVRVFSLQHKGVSAARNFGIKNAKGTYVSFVDADDWIDQDVCRIFCQALNNHDLDLFCFSAKFHKGSQKKQSFLFSHNIEVLNSQEKKEIHLKIMTPWGPNISYPTNSRCAGAAWGKFYKKQILLDNDLFFDEQVIISEDCLFNIIAFDKFQKIGYSRDIFYHYTINLNSAQNRFRPHSERYFSRIINKVNAWLGETKKDQSFRDAANTLFVHYLFGILKEDLFHKNNVNKKNSYAELKSVLSQETFQKNLFNFKREYFTLSERILISLLQKKQYFFVRLLIGLYGRFA